jgi:tetratricopeptide (TPR) repeat protein
LQKWFYPIEIEERRDQLAFIYSRECIHKALAGAAKFGSARAYYHLCRCFETADLDDEAEWLLSKAKELGKDDYVLQSWMVYSREEKECILQSAPDPTPEIKYQLARLKRREEALPLLEDAVKTFKYANVELARRQPSWNDRLRLYLEAGNDGVPDGYFFAALMMKRAGDMHQAQKYYQKAAELGQMSSCVECLEYALSEGDIREADTIAQRMQDEGSYIGFRKIGD